MRKLVALVAILLLVVCAFGDGTYAKMGGFARPNIPNQRGVISFRDGVETMVVESQLDGPEGDYVWIVPLPNPPTSVIAIDHFSLDKDFRRVSPSTLTSSPPATNFLPVYIVWLGLGLGAVLAADQKRKAKRTLTFLLAGIFATFVLLPVFATSVSAGKAGGGLQSVAAIRAGNNRVDVLKTRKAEELRKWIAKRGGTLTKEADFAVEAYSKEGWCFAVAQLDKHRGGAATPHPLAFTFESKELIYPMRLTGTQPGSVLLDLVVIADGTASLPPLRTLVSKRAIQGRFNAALDEHRMVITPVFEMAKKEEVFTRLRGVVAPEQMRADFRPRVGEFRPVHVVLANDNAVSGAALTAALLWGAGIALFAGLALGLLSISRPARIILWSLAILIAAGLVYRNAVDKFGPFDSEWLAIKSNLQGINKTSTKTP